MSRDREGEVSLKPNLEMPKHFARVYRNPILAATIAAAPKFIGNWMPFAVLLLFVASPLAFVLPAFFPFGKRSTGPGGIRMVASPQGFLLRWYSKIVQTTPWSAIQKIAIECPAEGYWGRYYLVIHESSGPVTRRVFLVEQVRFEPHVKADTYSNYAAFLDAIETNIGAVEGRDKFESRFSRGTHPLGTLQGNQPSTAPVRFFRSFEDPLWQEGISLGGLSLVVGGILTQSLWIIQIGLPIFLSAIVLAKGLAWLNIRLSKKRLVVEGDVVRLERPGKVLRELEADQISKIELHYRVSGWWDRPYVEVLIDSPKLPSIQVTVNEEDFSDSLLKALESLAEQTKGELIGALPTRYGLHMSFELPQASVAVE